MNSDSPTDPRSTLESSLTALLLGELPHEQAAALHQKLAQDAELAKLYERLKHTIALVRETVVSPSAQTTEPLIPLRLEEPRRQKLLQHFKTVARKEFVQPRRRVTRWLVPLSIAAAFVVILGVLFLPAMSRSKGGGQLFSFNTWSMSEKAESAAAEEEQMGRQLSKGSSSGRSEYFGDVNRNGHMERYGLKGQTISKGTPGAPPPQAAPPPVKVAGTAIVLPKATEVADLTIAPQVAESVQAGFAVSGTARGYYDDSLARAGGVGGGGDSAVTKGARQAALRPQRAGRQKRPELIIPLVSRPQEVLRRLEKWRTDSNRPVSSTSLPSPQRLPPPLPLAWDWGLPPPPDLPPLSQPRSLSRARRQKTRPAKSPAASQRSAATMTYRAKTIR